VAVMNSVVVVSMELQCLSVIREIDYFLEHAANTGEGRR
jgi:hypothetical protein